MEKARIFKSFFTFLLFFYAFFPLFAQNDPSGALSLAAETSRLEKIAFGVNGNIHAGAASTERYNAFLDLARLYLLSGNPEAALQAYTELLTVFPGDYRALLRQARLLLSLGEYEKAGAALNAVLSQSQDRDFIIQGQYLGALLEAFSSGNTGNLAILADDPDFAEYRSGMYYTLWKLSGLSSWKDRLTAEFPQSPEAKIAAGGIDSAPTPLWLLFPGRDSLALAPAQAAPSPVSAPAPAASSSGIIPAASIIPSIPAAPQDNGKSGGPVEAAVQTRVLQTGLFGKEENARALAEKIRKAGFESQIVKRQVNGNDYWAVYVPCGNDENVTIKKLKDAGFESFPTKP